MTDVTTRATNMATTPKRADAHVDARFTVSPAPVAAVCAGPVPAVEVWVLVGRLFTLFTVTSVMGLWAVM
jgi:hypothetical protein